MKAAIGFGVGDHAVAGFVFLVGALEITGGVFTKIVVVDEFLAGVVGRVDINHLDLAQIGFLQQLERIEVVAFDKQVLRGIKVDAFLAARAQGFGNRRVGGQ